MESIFNNATPYVKPVVAPVGNIAEIHLVHFHGYAKRIVRAIEPKDALANGFSFVASGLHGYAKLIVRAIEPKDALANGFSFVASGLHGYAKLIVRAIEPKDALVNGFSFVASRLSNS